MALSKNEEILAEEFNSLKAQVAAEMARRSIPNMSRPVLNPLPSNDAIAEQKITTNKLNDVLTALNSIHPNNLVSRYSSTVSQEELIRAVDVIQTYVNSLAAKPVTGAESGCNASCSGLCSVGCYTHCTGCASTCASTCTTFCIGNAQSPYQKNHQDI